jgi:hypothetical protein
VGVRAEGESRPSIVLKISANENWIGQPCAEHVLQSLLSHYKAELGPSMASLLQQSSDPQNMEGLLLKEGIYCAFGRSPSDLEGSIDFDKWLDQTLVVEAAGIDSK